MISKCENGTANIPCGGVGNFWIEDQMGPMTLCWKCYQEENSLNMPLIREQIAKEIEAYAKTQKKTMQKAAYECAAIARGEVK